MQSSLTGMPGTAFRSESEEQQEEDNRHGGMLESFGSCLLVDPASSLGQSLPQLGNNSNMLQPYPPANRLAPIPEGEGSAQTSMGGDEAMQDVQSHVRALTESLQDKTQEVEALHHIVDQFKSEVCWLKLQSQQA